MLFEELTRRMPDLAVAGEVERRSSTWATSLTAMPVFSPRERAAV